MSLEEKEINRENIFHGKIIDLDVETVELPNGETSTREIVRHHGAVCCLVINDQDQCLLVNQWREPIKRTSVEIPAGKVDARDDSLLSAMKRELNEETGYQAEYIEQLLTFYSTVGFSDEKLTLFYCDSIKPAAEKLPQDEDEFLQKMWVSLAEAKQMIVDEQIIDLKTIYAITYWENLKLRSEKNDTK